MNVTVTDRMNHFGLKYFQLALGICSVFSRVSWKTVRLSVKLITFAMMLRFLTQTAKIGLRSDIFG